jgi:hypothetical protein
VPRALGLLALVGVAALLSACAGDAQKPAAAPGSPENPLVAKTTESGSTGRSNEANGKAVAAPGYQKLVQRQPSKPQRRFTPCNLVTRAEARAILDAPVQALREAPQGPTCVYRSKPGRQFVTLAVQSLDFDRIRKQIRRPHAVDVANRRAYCGEYGQPMLYVSLTHGRVLTVGAPCRVARQFATRGVKRLSQ